MLLVTGGAGFIGSNFVENWLSRHAEPVLNVDALTYAGSLQNLAALRGNSRHIFVRGNIADRATIEMLLAEYKPRAIINFAAESHVDRAIHRSEEFVNTNVVGTYSLLEAAHHYYRELSESNRTTFRFLQISTDEVFGSLADDQKGFDEASSYRPNNPYSASKAAGDHFARAWYRTYGLPIIVTHSCNNFGPRQHSEKLIPRIISCALKGDRLPIYGDGLQRREWVYVKDNCMAIEMILARGQIGENYVIGGAKDICNLELVKLICSHLDTMVARESSFEEQITFVGDRPGHDRRYAIDDSRIRRELGWQPRAEFAEELYGTVRWYVDHPEHISD